VPVEGEPLAVARLRTGQQLAVLDASKWGLMTEGTGRLLPGRHLDVHVVTPKGRILVRARVARAHVCRLRADAIHYRVALAFDQPVDTSPCEGSLRPALDTTRSAAGSADDADRSARGEIVFNERVTE